MRYKALVVLLLFLFAVSMLVPALGQNEAALSEATALSPAPATPISIFQNHNYAVVDNEPMVLMWARGLRSAEDVGLYAESGLTVLYVQVDRIDEASLNRTLELLDAAYEEGLPAVVGIDQRLANLAGNGEAITAKHPLSRAYQQAVWEYASGIVRDLGGHPAVIGWVVEGLSSQDFRGYGPDFQLWLEDVFGNIDNLNEFWGTNFEDFSQIGLSSPREIDKFNIASLGRATIDSGLYYYWRYRELLNLWAQALRRAAPNDFVILGTQPDYRSLAAMPNNFHGVVAGVAGPKYSPYGGYGGVEGIDIARRANKHLSFGYANTQNLSGETLYDWGGQCLAHGAAGLVLEGWERIKADAGLQSALQRLNQLSFGPDVFPRTPYAETAILYEPLGGGSEYGFLPQQPSNEPGALFSAFSRGTRYGAVDYLTEDMLTSTNLRQYGVIFAPLVFTVSPAGQQALVNYVNSGGILVADWGIGTYESGGLHSLPDTLSRLFGVGLIYAVDRTPLDILVYDPDPLFPSLEHQASTSGRRKGGAFEKILGDVKIYGQSKRLMARHAWGALAPSVLLNHVGQGHAIFASAALWENWQRGDNLFAEFHGDLVSRRRSLWVASAGNIFITEDPVLYTDSSVGLFRTSASPLPTVVQVSAENNFLYSIVSGYQVVGPAQPTFAFTGRGVNIAVPLEKLQARGRGAQAYVQVRKYSPEAIVLEVYGPGATFVSRDTETTATGGKKANLILIAQSDEGAYSFAANSKHQVILRNIEDNQQISRSTVAASDQAILQIPVSGSALLVEITPAAETAE